MEGFWVRDEVKKHDTQKLIEGNLRPGSRVAIVDDVFTKGNSALKAAKAVREIGCEIVLVLALVDRLQGARALFNQNGIANYRSVFTIRDLGVDVAEDGLAQESGRELPGSTVIGIRLTYPHPGADNLLISPCWSDASAETI
ncbi:MAG TPA: hypothetical protein VGL71_10790 [Urbifossiella sp.]